MSQPQLQQTFLTLPLVAMGCPLYPPFEDPSSGTRVKVRVKLRDTVRFMVLRWSHEPEATIGLPVVAGVPLEEIEKLAKQRLFEEFERRHLEWPEQKFVQNVEQPNGQN